MNRRGNGLYHTWRDDSSCVLSIDLLNLKNAWETSGLSDSGQSLAKLEVASSFRFPLHFCDQNPGKTGVRYF
jgi:hypothetical protein